MDGEQTMTNTGPVNSEVVNVQETSSFLSDDSYMQEINQENIRFNVNMDYNSPNSPAQDPTISLNILLRAHQFPRVLNTLLLSCWATKMGKILSWNHTLPVCLPRFKT